MTRKTYGDLVRDFTGKCGPSYQIGGLALWLVFANHEKYDTKCDKSEGEQREIASSTYWRSLFLLSALAFLICCTFALIGCDEEGTATEDPVDTESVPQTATDNGTVEDPGGTDNSGTVEDSGGTDDTETVEPIGYEFETVEVVWEPCSLYHGQDDGRAECAMVAMKQRWGTDHPGTFDVWVKRLKSREQPSQGQVWFLSGGPGLAGTQSFADYFNYVQTQWPDLDLYTLDMRGTGDSGRLTCPEQEDPQSDAGSQIHQYTEAEACGLYLQETLGERLSDTRLTHSAIDLAALIHQTRTPDRQVDLVAGSAGTQWAQRFLLLFPDAVDAVVLVGSTPPDNSKIEDDDDHIAVFRELAAQCASDPLCGAKMPDMEGTFKALMEKLEEGHCSELGFSGVEAPRFGYLVLDLLRGSPELSAVPGLIYRAARCSPGDVHAIEHLKEFVSRPSPTDVGSGDFSAALFDHIVSSEEMLNDTYRTSFDLYTHAMETWGSGVFSHSSAYAQYEVFRVWPRYEDPYDNQWPVTDVPMLILQGELDPTNYLRGGRELGEYYTGPHQHLALLRGVSHSVTSNYHHPDDEAFICTWQIYSDFIRNPTGELDMSCMDQIPSIEFEGAKDAPELMGTADFWENDEEQTPDKKLEPRRTRQASTGNNYMSPAQLRLRRPLGI